ncbi:MAG: type II toxin-antitoxin system VapC family toxin [Anaerolineae bacterium]|nr:type II toxin-antitoxin system VapC family toxin [Anaerolineae bacterium]
MSEQYAVDTSALIQAYIEDNHTPNAKEMIARLLSETPPELHIVDIALAEAANVLWKRVVLHKQLSADVAGKALTNLCDLPIIVHESSPLLSEALKLGIGHGLAIYDVLVLALVRELDCPLITADNRQEAVAGQIGIAIKPITDFAPSP